MTSASQNQPLQVFIIYAREDERFRERLVKNMALLKREGVISTWYDRMIVPGQEWDKVITENLKASRVFLLLVSSDFLASEYISDTEMDHALKMHNAGLAVVIPIILRPCDWKETRIKGLQALPRDGKPVTEWPNRDRAWTDVVQGIRKAVTSLRTKLITVSSPSPEGSPVPESPTPGMALGEIQPEEASISAIKSELAYSETERIPITEEGAGPDAPTEEVSELIKLKEAKTRRRAIPWIASLLGLGLLTAIGLFIILTPTITNNPLAVSTPSVTPSAFAGQPTTLPIQETDTPILLPTNTLSLPINTPLPLPTDTSLPIPTDTPIPQVGVISVENAERLVPVRAIRALEDAAGTAISIIISPDGQYLVASLIVSLRPPQSDIGIWKVANGEFVHRIDNISGLPDKLSFSIDEGTLIVSEDSTSYTDARLTLWNMNALVSQLRSDTPSGSFHVASGSLAISRDLNTLAVTHELAEDPFNIIKIRQHPDGKLLHTLESRGSVSSLVFSPDGQTLASATGSSIELWNAKDGSLLDTLEGHAGWLGKISFSQNSQIIASSGGMDKTIRLWKNRKLWHELIGHTDWVSEFTFSPDGTILASGSYLGSISDKSVRLWDVETGTLLKTLEGHALSLAFSPDGRTLAGLIGETVQLWEVR